MKTIHLTTKPGYTPQAILDLDPLKVEEPTRYEWDEADGVIQHLVITPCHREDFEAHKDKWSPCPGVLDLGSSYFGDPHDPCGRRNFQLHYSSCSGCEGEGYEEEECVCGPPNKQRYAYVRRGWATPRSNILDRVEHDPIPPSALQAALDHLIDTGVIETTSNNRGHQWLAQKVGVSDQSVRNWVSGRKGMAGTSARLVRIVLADALGGE